MAFSLSLNTNPLVNRFAEPEDLIDTVADRLRIRDLQLTHEFINPSWPASLIRALTRRMQAALNRTGVRVTSGMTGPYGRLNHFGHPEPEVRRYYVDWFKTFADIIGDLGGQSVGTQFAIFTYRDYDDPKRREALIRIAIDCWAEVAEHAKRAGLSYVFWEPMSVGREFGETIEACLSLQTRLTAAKMAVPMWMMADIDHGDVTSANPRRLRPLRLGARRPARLPDHPHQAVAHGQGRPPPLHRRVQREGPHPARAAARGLPRGRRRRQRDLPRTLLQGARAERPAGDRPDRRVRRLLAPLY